MASSLLLFFALVGLSSAAVTCDLNTQPATWVRVLAKNAFFNAYEPNNYFNVPSFCVNNDFFSHSLNYSSHVNLADSTAKVQQDVVLVSKFTDKTLINCGQSNGLIPWCLSHCQNKQLENLIISTAAINGSLPLAVAQQVYTTLGSPADTSIASIQVDLSHDDLRIDYDFYDDVNFCSILVEVKNPGMFPYALFLTVQKIITA